MANCSGCDFNIMPRISQFTIVHRIVTDFIQFVEVYVISERLNTECFEIVVSLDGVNLQWYSIALSAVVAADDELTVRIRGPRSPARICQWLVSWEFRAS